MQKFLLIFSQDGRVVMSEIEAFDDAHAQRQAEVELSVHTGVSCPRLYHVLHRMKLRGKE